jgi:hypothetical protein
LYNLELALPQEVRVRQEEYSRVDATWREELTSAFTKKIQMGILQDHAAR